MKYMYEIVVTGKNASGKAFYDGPTYENVSDAITAANALRDSLLGEGRNVTLATVFELGAKDGIVWQWKSMLDKINDLQS